MTAALGATRRYLRHLTTRWSRRAGSPRPFLTILDVLPARPLGPGMTVGGQ
nr:hypothetical protein [Propionibacterium sp.]